MFECHQSPDIGSKTSGCTSKRGRNARRGCNSSIRSIEGYTAQGRVWVNGLRVIEVEHIDDEEVLVKISDFTKIAKVPGNLVEFGTYGVYVVKEEETMWEEVEQGMHRLHRSPRARGCGNEQQSTHGTFLCLSYEQSGGNLGHVLCPVW